MYQYVSENEIKKYRSCCSGILSELKDVLYSDYGINTYVTLIGSGAKNMVTRNGDAAYDLDYNLIIIAMPEEYESSQELKKLKDLVRVELDNINSELNFSNGKDSTSAITTILHFEDTPQIQFSFDIAILIKDESGYHRLKNDKYNGRFIWNLVPSSNNCKEKADLLKDFGVWNEVRDEYLNKKNFYLRNGNPHHPSFNVYIETVNQIYDKYKNKRR